MQVNVKVWTSIGVLRLMSFTVISAHPGLLTRPSCIEAIMKQSGVWLGLQKPLVWHAHAAPDGPGSTGWRVVTTRRRTIEKGGQPPRSA